MTEQKPKNQPYGGRPKGTKYTTKHRSAKRPITDDQKPKKGPGRPFKDRVRVTVQIDRLVARQIMEMAEERDVTLSDEYNRILSSRDLPVPERSRKKRTAKPGDPDFFR